MTKQEAIDLLNNLIGFIEDSQGSDYDEALKMAIKALEQEPKTGHWIEQDGYDGDTYYDCSECGESFCLIDGTPTDNLYNYCPTCGAKMTIERTNTHES